MVSRIGRVCSQTRRYAVALFLLAVVNELIAELSADNIKVRDKKQVENEWASTSKRDHKGPNTFEFRYDVENAPSNNIQYRMEERHPNGSVVGSYGQVQPGGNIKVVSYIADKDGIKTYVKDKGLTDNYVAEGSSLDPVQRVTSQIIQTAVQSQQTPHRSPLHDKYHRPTPAPGPAHRVDAAHTYHQQRTNVDPAAFRPEDSPGYQESNQPFIGDQLQGKLQTTNVAYQSTPQQQQQPMQLVQGVTIGGPSPSPPQQFYGVHQQTGAVVPVAQQPQQPTHYMLNVPPLPSLGDNSPLPLMPGQQPLPITPDRGPVMIQLQQQQPQQPLPPQVAQQQQQYQYQPTQAHPQQLRLPPGNLQQQQQLQQQQHQQYSQAMPAQQYQQQPVRVQPPVHLQQQQQQHAVQYQPQQARVVTHQVLPPTSQQQQNQQHQQQQLLQQQQQQHQQQLQQQQQQQQQRAPFQQSVMQQPYPQQVNIPAHPSQVQVRGNVQQHQTVVPMQYFHQPNPATTMEQYRQQLQLQAAESQILPVFVLPPSGNGVFSFKGSKRFRF